jgi:nitroimidazol reductase NimA-like FMN-containing flavoprotein (pyridoxamine 5'-phosphate oxidase superfamily)
MIGKLTDEQIEEILQQNAVGRIGCNDGEKNYVVPVNYVYDGKFIIAHSLVGMKISIMRKKPEVCFEVDEIKGLSKWKSVIAWGRYQELHDEHDRYYAMKIFIDKMLHLKISKSAIALQTGLESIHPNFTGHIKPVIFRIVLTEKTGRYEDG